MYPVAVINCVISFGLIYLAFRREVPTIPQKSVPNQATVSADESVESVPVFPPSRSLLFPALIFGCANIFLFVVPLIRPPPESEPYEHLPYWVHAVGGWCIFLVGGLWWVWRYRGRL